MARPLDQLCRYFAHHQHTVIEWERIWWRRMRPLIFPAIRAGHLCCLRRHVGFYFSASINGDGVMLAGANIHCVSFLVSYEKPTC
jgi:hypothetical protein